MFDSKKKKLNKVLSTAHHSLGGFKANYTFICIKVGEKVNVMQLLLLQTPAVNMRGVVDAIYTLPHTKYGRKVNCSSFFWIYVASGFLLNGIVVDFTFS